MKAEALSIGLISLKQWDIAKPEFFPEGKLIV
jgi:hypothetical protein